MRLLTNPIFIRMAVAFFVGMAAFIAGIFVIRALRRRIVEDSTLSEGLGQEDTLYPYTAVIQQLKQQKFELQNEQQLQRKRAKASEQMAAAVIANLPCGVLFIGPNGLVKQVNSAARQILGFASPIGMSLDALFRQATAVLDTGTSAAVAEVFRTALRDQTRQSFESTYRATNGDDRTLRFALIPLSTAPGESTGLAAVIADESASSNSRRARILHSEVSAEMALELRGSIAIIRECAGQMLRATDRASAESLAKDITAEAERLDKVVGGFLAGSSSVAASAGA